MKRWLSVLTVVCVLSVAANATLLEVGAGKPYLTIQAAIDASIDGDEINIYAGTYAEDVLVTDKENLYVHANTGDKVVVDGMLDLYNASSATWTQNNTFERLWIDRTGDASGWAVNNQYSRNNTFKEMVIFGDNSGSNGMYGYLQYGLNIAENTTFYGLGVAYSHGYNSGLNVFDSIVAFNASQSYNYPGGYAGAASYSNYFNNSDLPTNVGDTTGTIHLDPLFASTDPGNPNFLWLTQASPSAGTDAQGDNMGALPTVIPEPATMILLGLGALAMRKRKQS